jgi:hypothetical protein
MHLQVLVISQINVDEANLSREFQVIGHELAKVWYKSSNSVEVDSRFNDMVRTRLLENST